MKKRLLAGALLLFVLLSASCTKEETPSPSSSFDVEGKKTLSFSSFDGSGSSFDISRTTNPKEGRDTMSSSHSPG